MECDLLLLLFYLLLLLYFLILNFGPNFIKTIKTSYTNIQSANKVNDSISSSLSPCELDRGAQVRSGQRVQRAHSEQAVVAHACHGHRYCEGVRGDRLHWRVQRSTSNPTGIGSRRSVVWGVMEFGMFRRITPREKYVRISMKDMWHNLDGPPKYKELWSYVPRSHWSLEVHSPILTNRRMAGQYHYLWTGQYDQKWNTTWCIVDQSQDVCDVLYVIITFSHCMCKSPVASTITTVNRNRNKIQPRASRFVCSLVIFI